MECKKGCERLAPQGDNLSSPNPDREVVTCMHMHMGIIRDVSDMYPWVIHYAYMFHLCCKYPSYYQG